MLYCLQKKSELIACLFNPHNVACIFAANLPTSDFAFGGKSLQSKLKKEMRTDPEWEMAFQRDSKNLRVQKQTKVAYYDVVKHEDAFIKIRNTGVPYLQFCAAIVACAICCARFHNLHNNTSPLLHCVTWRRLSRRLRHSQLYQ